MIKGGSTCERGTHDGAQAFLGLGGASDWRRPWHRSGLRRPAGGGRRTGTVTDLDLSAAQEVVAGLPDAAGPHVALVIDVTDRLSVDKAVAQAADVFGGLDGVVNVAGGDLPHGAFEEISDEIWLHLLELNLVGSRGSVVRRSHS